PWAAPGPGGCPGNKLGRPIKAVLNMYPSAQEAVARPLEKDHPRKSVGACLGRIMLALSMTKSSASRVARETLPVSDIDGFGQQLDVNEARTFSPVPKIGSVQWSKAEVLAIKAKVEYLVFPKSIDGFVFTELIDPMCETEMLPLGVDIELMKGNEVEVLTLEMKKVGKTSSFEKADAVVGQEGHGAGTP
ncbi:hypothetical protein, partial [Streptomyces cinereoruber]|uniref:hypothetical protein n=1 Tax=Streptomyces cinereoruber TaxID=67260 RepID=UPI0036392F01